MLLYVEHYNLYYDLSSFSQIFKEIKVDLTVIYHITITIQKTLHPSKRKRNTFYSSFNVTLDNENM